MRGPGTQVEDAHERLMEATYARLTHCYGHERAAKIMAGDDAKTKADLMAWRHLGRRPAA